MIILENFNSTPSLSKPCVLTIGNFDGVHLGHQALLKQMRALAGESGTLCVVTFSNHPSYILPGRTPVPLILSKELKLSVLETFRVDVAYCLKFTQEIAAMSYDAFVTEIRKSCPFDILVLGEGDGFGRKREGTQEKVEALGHELGFNAIYLPKITDNKEHISSGRIRGYIKSGELRKAAALLGRPVTLEGCIEEGQLQLPPNLCLPPDGRYPVLVESSKTLVHLKNGKVLLDLPVQSKKITLSFT